ncbi:RHS repeat domain-containing protein [Desulforhopalus singaporensis]|uniref:RHS repeat-associated core domain-containing protein n=1 Tax=Desulforhopalus singaporensis TaxID=91360 RepID=A0A1H0W5Y6_9BACT|nr:RHS repeat-associated core domain-containing protein [Desulforhopalus singaporensis]SDP85716.1 RHS repeat-associated core domain-containing protein [Desulforhopalus singaporensis]
MIVQPDCRFVTKENVGIGFCGKHENMAKKVKSTDYIYDGLEVLQEITGSGSQQITTYHRALGRIVSRQDYTTGDSGQYHVNRPRGQRLYYAYYGLGSVVALTAHNGRQKTRYRYDAFGELISGDITDNRFTFTGKQLDPESGLYHFHFRQYDPSAGVWTTEDPIGIIGGNNLYSYTKNNRVNNYDILGLVSAGELGLGNPGSYGGENTEDSMRDEFGPNDDSPYDNSPYSKAQQEKIKRVNEYVKPRVEQLAEAMQLLTAIPSRIVDWGVYAFQIDDYFDKQREKESSRDDCEK